MTEAVLVSINLRQKKLARRVARRQASHDLTTAIYSPGGRVICPEPWYDLLERNGDIGYRGEAFDVTAFSDAGNFCCSTIFRTRVEE